MGTARALVAGSGFWPEWSARVSGRKVVGSSSAIAGSVPPWWVAGQTKKPRLLSGVAARGPVFGPAAYIVVTARDVRPAPLGRPPITYTYTNGVSSQPVDSARRIHRSSTLATETQRWRAPRGQRRTIVVMTAIPAEFPA